MEHENLVVIAIYPNEMEAQLARTVLDAAHIDSILQKDDAGGMLPNLDETEGVKIFVDQKDAAEAKTILTNPAFPASDNTRLDPDWKP